MPDLASQVRRMLRRLFRHRCKMIWNTDPTRTITTVEFGTTARFGECQRCGQLTVRLEF